MDSSKELEKEMDREISAASARSNELQLRSEKLKGDVDEWKVSRQAENYQVVRMHRSQRLIKWHHFAPVRRNTKGHFLITTRHWQK
jgi:hypothetical protein